MIIYNVYIIIYRTFLPGNTSIAFMTPKENIHKEIKKMTGGIQITYSHLKKSDSRFLEMTTTPMKKDEYETTPSRIKETDIPKVQAHGVEPNGIPGKLKISSL